MFSIEKSPVPADTMLEKYSMNGAYTDCYSTEISHRVSFTEFIFAFYTTPLFKTEALILKFTVSKPSTDEQARQLADGEIESFAAWAVENRSENQLLMCDFMKRTRSWFMVLPIDETRTKLYFGSAVSSREDLKTGKLSLGFVFQVLLGFHQIYSILLLSAAKSRLQRGSLKQP
jgi:hypothetical protein